MKWLQLAVDMIAPFEGCEKKYGGLIYPYLDKLAKPPRPTRGYGRTYGITMESPPITPKQARDELKVGALDYGLRCALMAPALFTRPACWAAVTSWTWNCGTGAFEVSRLRKAINEGRWEDAAELITKPNTAGGVVYRGLTRRREAERALFLTGVR